jgi:ribose/xylose/arabinose/galactoside ABC-type transport system permease subunit
MEGFAYEAFPDAEGSYRKRTREMVALHIAPRWLAWIVFIAALGWMIVSALSALWFIVGRPVGELQDLVEWLSFGERFLYALWLSALACMVALYISRRALERSHG